jgi:hypothetical protein
MEIKDKASILVEFIQVNFTDPKFEEFFDYNDLGLPLAVAFENDLCTLNDKGTEVLNETYDLMLEEYGVDKDKTYETLDDIIEDSSNG